MPGSVLYWRHEAHAHSEQPALNSPSATTPLHSDFVRVTAAVFGHRLDTRGHVFSDSAFFAFGPLLGRYGVAVGVGAECEWALVWEWETQVSFALTAKPIVSTAQQKADPVDVLRVVGNGTSAREHCINEPLRIANRWRGQDSSECGALVLRDLARW